MKNLYINTIKFFYLLFLVGCGGNSVLLNQTITFNTPSVQGKLSFITDPNDHAATVIYYGNFTYTQTLPINCTSTGHWDDLNPGAAMGGVIFTYLTDTCNTPNLVGQNIGDTYEVVEAQIGVTSSEFLTLTNSFN